MSASESHEKTVKTSDPELETKTEDDVQGEALIKQGDVEEVIEVDKSGPAPDDLSDGDDDDADVKEALAREQYGDDDADGALDDEDGEEEKTENENEIKNDAILVLSDHTDAVYCVAFCPTNSSIAASGAGDDTARIFNTADGSTLHSYGRTFLT